MKKNDALLFRRLIFDWTPPRWNKPLIGFLAASLLLHFAAFYLFHIVYPTTNSLLPPGAQVSVLNPKNPDDHHILDWVELHDPSALNLPKFRNDLVPGLVPRYRPSFSTISPDPLPQPQPSASRQAPMPSLLSAESLFPLRGKPKITPVERTFVTRLEFGNNLRSRHPEISASLPTASEILEPSIFFVGVNPEGKIEYLFLWQTSGNDRRDSEAERFLRQIHFQSAPSAAWDLVKFCWGMTRP
ncbi:MAG TPA: hypothetical protein VE242_09795 [Chthoniobacterales bacterium]|nr:hypothetical protein [Chthoniobacterales bacterium]